MENVTNSAAARRNGRRRARWLTALGSLWLATLATAAQPSASFQVELLLSDDGPAYRQLAGAFQAELSIACANRCPVTPSVRVSQVQDWQADAPRDLLVTAGTEAALQSARRVQDAAVYGLIPEATWRTVQQLRPQTAADATAVFLEQPLARQFRLLRLALPADRRRVGVLLGPESARLEQPLREAAAAQGLALKVQQVAKWNEVGPAVESLSAEIDVLLAVPDTLVYNHDTLYGILLASYGAGVPVVGYSRGLVGAGAMLGLYTSIPDMARQLAQVSADFIAQGGRLPPAAPSRYFEISLNQNVAESLGMPLPETSELRRALEPPR